MVLGKEVHVAGVLRHNRSDLDPDVGWMIQVGILGSSREVVHCSRRIQDGRRRMQVVGAGTWMPPAWTHSLDEP